MLRLLFFIDPASAVIYTLSLHDALPICPACVDQCRERTAFVGDASDPFELDRFHILYTRARVKPDRKSTRLNSSHRCISYAVFCLKKKNKSTVRSYLRRRIVMTKHRPTL